VSTVPILFEGGGLLVVDKPAGVPVIPGRTADGPPPLQQQLEQTRQRKLWVVHRLDRDTSGVLLFATTPEMHRAASMAFEEGTVHKRYLALVRGVGFAPQEVTAALVPARRSRMRVAREGEDGKAARTRFRPLQPLAGATLVEAEPLTGRTHQIRVHLQHLGHPLLVDHQYGTPGPLALPGGAVLFRTPLHALELRLPPLAGQPGHVFTAPLPRDMAEAVTALGGTSW
jgi:tRNA pseudouridine32 synthase/23S rRNA pseudouridine746 synthase/23S rRNA pseudouridine955/2504/2580 synthase